MKNHGKNRFVSILLAAAVLTAWTVSAAEEASSDEDKKTQKVEVSSALDTQVALSRAGFSPGVIDGNWGDNTNHALSAWQRAHGLEATGELDDKSAEKLAQTLDGPSVVEYQLTEEDVSYDYVEPLPESAGFEEMAEREQMGYTSVEEKLAELFHTTPEWLRQENPDAQLEAGETLRIPNVERERKMPEDTGDLKVVVVKETSELEVHQGDGKILFYAPVTAGSEVNPLPMGEWKVTAIAVDPTYSFDPELFPEIPDDAKEVTIAPGPNNPVGKVWISIDKEHYGLHGTAEPAKIGYDESHGCVRLTNWDAMYLAHLVDSGTPVEFVESRSAMGKGGSSSSDGKAGS